MVRQLTKTRPIDDYTESQVNPKPGAAKGKGKGKGKKKTQPRRFSSSASGFNEEQDWYGEAIVLMSRMLTRQEDVLTVLRQSTGWVWWLRVQAPTIVPDLFQAAQVWKKEVTDPKSLMAGTSLRSALLWCILHRLSLALQSEDKAQLELAMQNGWCTKDKTWVYQVWSPAQQQLEIDETRKPLSTSAVLQLLSDMKSLISGDTVSRFHATRPLAGAHDGHGHLFSQGLRQRALQQVGRSTRPSSAPAVRSAIPKGRIQALSSGATAAGARELVCALTVRNPSNFCYMNVTLRGLLWALADHLDSSELFHRTGREALKLVLQHNAKPLHIFGMPMWRMLLHNWGNPQLQHDAAEFLAFLLSKLQASTFTWSWEARIGNESDTDSEVADRGNSQQAITLDLPGQEGPYDLQLLLNAWHEQAHTHALTGDATLSDFQTCALPSARR